MAETKKRIIKKNTLNKISKKEKLDVSESDEMDVAAKIESILDALRKNYLEQKRLEKEIRDLLPLHKKEIKQASKHKKNINAKKTGFALKNDVPESIKNFFDLDDEPMSRTDISKLFYKYFRENDLQDEKDKRNINTNKDLRKLFEMSKEDKLTIYNFNTWLKKLYNQDKNNDESFNLIFD